MRAVEELPDEIIVLIWGASSVACLSLAKLLEQSEILENEEIVAPDWILDARLLESTRLVLVTAHNVFHCYELKDGKFLHKQRDKTVRNRACYMQRKFTFLLKKIFS